MVAKCQRHEELANPRVIDTERSAEVAADIISLPIDENEILDCFELCQSSTW